MGKVGIRRLSRLKNGRTTSNQLLDLIETAILPSRGITILELERFNRCFKRKGGDGGRPLRRLPRCFQQEKTHPMRLIDAAWHVSETTGSRDFIHSVLSLFARYKKAV